MRLLLLSNSTNLGQDFLEHALEAIREFLGPAVREVLFVPFAAVRFSQDEFAEKVRSRLGSLGYAVRSLHVVTEPVASVRGAEAIVVGGGNTFQLLDAMYRQGVLGAIRDRVKQGAPYIGWSAGSNVACPSIGTTNDMPIVEPPRFDALGLVPFQINPHFTDGRIPNHGGETRSERLLEFVTTNPEMPVVGLREGSMLRVEGSRIRLLGELPARLFFADRDPSDLTGEDSLQFLSRGK